MRQMIGGALPDLARREPQIFADLRSPLVLIKHHDAVWADEGVDQREVQVGQQRDRRVSFACRARFRWRRNPAPESCPRSSRCPRRRARARARDRGNSRRRSTRARKRRDARRRGADWPCFPPSLSRKQIRSIIMTYMDLSMPAEECGPVVGSGCGTVPGRVIPTHDSNSTSPRVERQSGLGA
jgi:hypothetical protein